MYFFLQTPDDSNPLKIDNMILKDLLEGNRVVKYKELTQEELEILSKEEIVNIGNNEKHLIPLGTIEFVTNFLKKIYGIDKINPVEIPICLRTPEFLNRNYKILQGRDVPKEGNYFVKDVSKLKSFIFCGDIKNLPEQIEDNKLYQVSDIIDIVSEYRIYIINGKIYAISFYDGDNCMFPDINKIQKANAIFSLQSDYIKSYTMDVAIDKSGNTVLLEIHPLFSCGLYSTVLSSDFLYGYRDSLEYIIRYNTMLSQ